MAPLNVAGLRHGKKKSVSKFVSEQTSGRKEAERKRREEWTGVMKAKKKYVLDGIPRLGDGTSYTADVLHCSK